MKEAMSVLLMCLCVVMFINAQSHCSIKGVVINEETRRPMRGVSVAIVETSVKTTSDVKGMFKLQSTRLGKQLLEIKLQGFKTLKLAINCREGTEIDLGFLLLTSRVNRLEEERFIAISEEELLEDEGNADNVTGMLFASKDAFSRAAAYSFGQAWFRVRGYDSENATVMINGISMNKIYGGRPQWSNWGGLNDATRTQEVTVGLAPTESTFGGVLGTTNMITTASLYRPGTKITVSATNKSYKGRLMVTHASGLKKNWAYTISASRRFAKEGYFEGSFYDANSFFTSLEYQPNPNQSFNLTAIYAHNKRGKNAGHTQEVWDLMGRKYNAYWGSQDGRKRNARVKEVNEPIIMLSHQLKINEKSTINTSVSYQFGTVGNSRLGYYKQQNPDPTYYRNLPSYFQKNAPLNPNIIPESITAFTSDPQRVQIDWLQLYKTNKALNTNNAGYYLYEDRNDDQTGSVKTVFSTAFTENTTVNLGLSYVDFKSENYANMLDLLGASYLIDRDGFTNTSHNLLSEDPVLIGDKFNYHYLLSATKKAVFGQYQYQKKKIDAFIAVQYIWTTYQREGQFQNELYKENSLGIGEPLAFNTPQFKAGLTYKITGRHLLDINAASIFKAPTLRNSYSNARVHKEVVLNLESEQINTVDIGYIHRSPHIKSRVTAYYTSFSKGTNISRYYDQNLGEFVAEVLTDVERIHLGVEVSFEYKITAAVNANFVASIGSYRYTNNPLSYYTSDDSLLSDVSPVPTFLKGYHTAGTPQQAFSLGMDYRSSKYWWIGVNANHLSHTYVAVASGLRTERFYTNPATNQRYEGIKKQDVKEILGQEEFEGYVLVNIIGGKSWKVKKKYISLFISASNVLNTEYRTGGYEQGRNGNYQLLKKDKSRKTPLFGAKYWRGYGASYYVNLSVSF
ncbi:MAG: TonB-dependent receptor [Flavobacteriaceae bacterium]|nr:TonB-dependent receptor [Flavobacteriaceae bacterium]